MRVRMRCCGHQHQLLLKLLDCHGPLPVLAQLGLHVIHAHAAQPGSLSKGINILCVMHMCQVCFPELRLHSLLGAVLQHKWGGGVRGHLER